MRTRRQCTRCGAWFSGQPVWWTLRDAWTLRWPFCSPDCLEAWIDVQRATQTARETDDVAPGTPNAASEDTEAETTP